MDRQSGDEALAEGQQAVVKYEGGASASLTLGDGKVDIVFADMPRDVESFRMDWSRIV